LTVYPSRIRWCFLSVQFSHATARLSPFTLVPYAGTINGSKSRRSLLIHYRHRRNIVISASTATFTTTSFLLLLLRSIVSILSSCSTPGVNGLASWLSGSTMSWYWAKRRIGGLNLTMVRRHSRDLTECWIKEEGR